MDNKKCIKCGSNDIFINKFKPSLRSWTKISPLTGVWVVEYICTQCGYIESYVEDVPRFRERVARIANKA